MLSFIESVIKIYSYMNRKNLAKISEYRFLFVRNRRTYVLKNKHIFFYKLLTIVIYQFFKRLSLNPIKL